MARSIAIALLTLGIALLAGCAGGGEVTPADTTAPLVSNLTVAPTALQSEGGSVKLGVTATDNELVSGVVFTVGRGATSVQLVGTKRGPRYEATYVAPSNSANAAATYAVSVQAHDPSDNLSRVLTGSISVAGLSSPPGPP